MVLILVFVLFFFLRFGLDDVIVTSYIRCLYLFWYKSSRAAWRACPLRHMHSGVATGVARGSRVPPLTAKNLPKIGENRKKIRKHEKKKDKSGRKGKNQEVSFTLPLLADRAGYATAPPNPIGRNDALPTAGGTPSRAPIGRGGTNRPEATRGTTGAFVHEL